LLAVFFCGEVFCAEKPEYSVRFTGQAPVIDGVLNDSCWQKAADGIKLCSALDRDDQQAIDTIPTQVRLLWDENYLYISYSCRDDDIFVTGTIKHDGNVYMQDVCEFFLDAGADGRQWMEIQVNPLNQTLDLMSFYLGAETDVSETGRITPEGRNNYFSLREWEAEGAIIASGRIVEDGKIKGWTVELAVPASLITKRLGGGPLKPCELRANIVRYDHSLTADNKRYLLFMSWGRVEFGCPHISPGAMGVLHLEP
jgi:hypothetical protein